MSKGDVTRKIESLRTVKDINHTALNQIINALKNGETALDFDKIDPFTITKLEEVGFSCKIQESPLRRFIGRLTKIFRYGHRTN